ncbi:MAG: hypothetical protein M8467_06875 [Anaerolineae bacterium]|nr:hypothetical protein [Anaerolineae bacterium]
MTRSAASGFALLTLMAALLAALSGLGSAQLPRPPSPTQPGAGSGAGWLAYIGADGNVYVVDAGLQSRLAITRDATAPAEGSGRSYHRLAWSRENQLAFAAVVRSGSQAAGQLYVLDRPDASPRAIAQDPDHFFIYISWSPGSCSGRRACSQLAYLVEGKDGVDLHLVSLDARRWLDRLAGTGRPFYFSWAPAGQEAGSLMAWHTGAEEPLAGPPRLALYDVAQHQARTLAIAPGSFLAPAWSPEGRHWLAVSREGAENQLLLLEADRPVQVITAAQNELTFSWSPDGRYIAYAARARAQDPFYGPVRLLDLSTGRAAQLTAGAFRIRGFFWAPVTDRSNGERHRLAYLTWLDLPGGEWSQWRVVDVDSGEDRGFAAFNPTPLMRFAIHSSSQYAQSHRFWSPDGRYLVYADRDERGVDRIWLVDTRAAPGSDPILVANGPLAYWSHR